MPRINKPFAAIITPLHDNPERIIRAIQSVRNQTYHDYIHFICDNGSSDNSKKIVEDYITKNKDAHIVFAVLSESNGRSYARNLLIQQAYLNDAQYIAFLDSDDYWTPNHLEVSIKTIEDQNAGMVFAKPIFVDDNGNPVRQHHVNNDSSTTYSNLSKGNFIYISSVVMNRTCTETVGEFDQELDYIEDWDYWLRVKKAGFSMVELNNVTTFYRERSNDTNRSVTEHKIKKLKSKHMIMDEKPIKLNLGCGEEILEGYINCDIEAPEADMYFDAAKIPFPDNSVDEIRAYHLIEHFPFQKGLAVIQEWFRALKPNGKLVLETPDFYHTCKKFVESDDDIRLRLYTHFFAWPDSSLFQAHFFLFTETQLRWSLESTGFVNVQRVTPDSVYAVGSSLGEELFLKMEAIKPSPIKVIKPKVYDAFLFYNEFDLLEMRLNELNDVVDHFVLVESTTTFTGQQKPLYYDLNKEKFKQFAHKITHVVVDNTPHTDSPWDAEIYQRNAISLGLKNCQPDDIVLISDVDEIPNKDAITNYNPDNGICVLQQKTSMYYINCVSNVLWWNAKIGVWNDIRKETPHGIRAINNRPVISEGGWHFTCLGGADAILNKLASFSRTEYNTPHFRDAKLLAEKVKNGWDLYDRIGCFATYWDIDETFPKYVRNQKQSLIEKGLIRNINPVTLPIPVEKYQALDSLNHDLYEEIFTQGGYMMYQEDIQGRVFVDVGANIGVTVINALSLGAKKVLAFEPNKANYQILMDFTAEYDNVCVYNHAVYNSQRIIQMSNEGMTSNMYQTTPTDEWVPAATLDEVAVLLQPDEIAVLKLDCEGAEFDIIYKSPPETVKRFDTIFFEMHNDLVPEYLMGDIKLIEYVTSLGFVCEKLPFASGMWYPDGTFVATQNSFYKCKNQN